MIATKKLQLTESQEKIVNALKCIPNEWRSAGDLWQMINPNKQPGKNEVSLLGHAMIYLPEKDSSIHKKTEHNMTLYCWSGSANVDKTSIERVVPVVITSDVSDRDLISAALLFYATNMIASNPKGALRCAYIAGKGEFGMQSPANSQPMAKKAKAIQSVVNVSPDRIKIIAELPPDMGYDEFVNLALAAYGRREFSFEESAKDAGLNVDYFERIVRGDATPTRDTLKKAYAAIFSR